VDVVLVVLLGPQHPGERLAHHELLVGVELVRDQRCVVLVGLLEAAGELAVEVDVPAALAQPHAHHGGLSGADLEHVVGRALRPRLAIDRAAVHQEVVDRGLPAGLVLAEQELAVGLEAPRAQLAVEGAHRVAFHAQRRPDDRAAPRPRVAKPQRGQHVQRRRLRPAVVHGDPHQQVIVLGLRVLDDDVEVAVAVEDAGVEQLILGVELAAACVGVHQVAVRERALRVLVERLQVGVGGRRVEVEPVLLGVLAVVALGVVEPEDPLLDDRVGAVPEREREAHPLALVADAEQPVLAPAVGARARLVVREGLPRVAVAGVVLAHRPPLALGQVGTPRLPRDLAGPRGLQSLVLGSHVRTLP
jgi:hypothetical protein